MNSHRLDRDRHGRLIGGVHQRLVDVALLGRELAEPIAVTVPCRLGVKKDNSHQR